MGGGRGKRKVQTCEPKIQEPNLLLRPYGLRISDFLPPLSPLCINEMKINYLDIVPSYLQHQSQP